MKSISPQSKGRTHKRLNLEQKLRLLVRLYRARERRRGSKSTSVSHPSSQSRMNFAAALAMLMVVAGSLIVPAGQGTTTLEEANQAYAAGRCEPMLTGQIAYGPGTIACNRP